MKMSVPRIASTLAVAIVLSSTGLAVEAQDSGSLHGGWVIAEWEAPDGQTGPVPERGLFVFAESGHYSIMFVIGGARGALDANPSDADVAAAYGPFVANSGRYSVSGNEITYEAFVAKDPAYMSQFGPSGGEGNAQTMTYEVSDGRLTLSFGEGGPMDRAQATLRRPGTP